MVASLAPVVCGLRALCTLQEKYRCHVADIDAMRHVKMCQTSCLVRLKVSTWELRLLLLSRAAFRPGSCGHVLLKKFVCAVTMRLGCSWIVAAFTAHLAGGPAPLLAIGSAAAKSVSACCILTHEERSQSPRGHPLLRTAAREGLPRVPVDSLFCLYGRSTALLREPSLQRPLANPAHRQPGPYRAAMFEPLSLFYDRSLVSRNRPRYIAAKV
jgi:hypothetical protein